jgi:hypothetical protein
MCLLRWFEGTKERRRLTKRAALRGDVHVEGEAAMERRRLRSPEEAREGAAEETRGRDAVETAAIGLTIVPCGLAQSCRLHNRYRFVTGNETTA